MPGSIRRTSFAPERRRASATSASVAGFPTSVCTSGVTAHSLSALALSTAASVLPLLAFALAAGERVWPQHWGALVGLAMCSQVLGQGLMTYVLGRFPPLVVGIALLIQPVVAGAVGWIVYGERLGVPDLVGVVMVAAALVLVRRDSGVAPRPPHAHLEGEEQP